MGKELYQTIEQIGREKGIDPEVIIQAVEEAMVAAFRKYFRSQENIVSRFNREKGVFEVFARKQVVEEVTNPEKEISLSEAVKYDPNIKVGEEINIPKSTEGLGRIAAQTAKQVIYQKVLEAEREKIFNEYHPRIGEIVNGIVKRFDRNDVIVDIGRTEAVLPKREQSPNETYSQGDRVRAVIIEVERISRGPQVVISRVDPQLLIKLFEMEVPEIYDGTIKIKNAVREPGERAKIAVYSTDTNVDPVGACVGMRGNRVQAIIRELKNEKIDIIEYSEDPATFIANALSPAKVSKVTILDEEKREAEVIVDSSQLSLAIGKKGQNVRLAAKLTGWKIDIKSEEEKKAEVKRRMDMMSKSEGMLRAIPGIGEKTAERLAEAGFDSLEKIAKASVEELSKLPSIGREKAEKIIKEARKLLR
ncbi:MAG: transcription termination/antitermination protein NusA [Acidobacteria bacterium]|nr:transcription termination/antitermination protein NusA [Acidobacteriota bacterium]